MVLSRLNLTKHLSLRFLNRYVYKMNQAYLRHLNDCEKFELTFQYIEPRFRIDRQFNFCRQVSETVSAFTQRVATNVEKIVKKKAKDHYENPIQVSLSVNGAAVADETVLCKDVFSDTKNEIILKVCDKEFNLLINSPWISGMVLPSSILAGFPVYPMRFESMYTDTSKSEFNWYKSTDKCNWTLVGNGFMYNTSNRDIGAYLKLSCLPKSGNLVGPTAEAVSNSQVEAGPGFCPFEKRHEFTKEKCTGKK